MIIKNILLILSVIMLLLFLGQAEIKSQETKPRVIVMTDGEVDDRSSMIRFLLYTNDVALLAIIETNSVYQCEGHSKEDWYEKQINAYEEVYPNLIVHDPDGNKMRFEWWQYQEAGSCDQMVKVDHAQGKKVSFVAPIVNQECTIHIVLEVSDSDSPALFSFQRMIITVEP
ncbi:MAG: DUF1593 domain-containing protein [Bacteroidia bacterium]|nr:MAG: DUF1593 domain-containing protein [Bacteroidia bacterium]